MTIPTAKSILSDIDIARQISAGLKPSAKWVKMQPTDEIIPGGKAYSNGVYTATLRKHQDGWPFGGGKWAMIGIHSEDGAPRHDWRDFQNIKNDLVGPDWEAIELYPSEDRLIDPSNYYMLWCAPKIKIGMNTGRSIATHLTCIAPQRPFAE